MAAERESKLPRHPDEEAVDGAIERETIKDLVLCFDGTGDWAASDSTNVAKIYSAVDASCVKFYDGGVGTLSNPQELDPTQRTVTRLVDAGIATGIGDKVLNGYRFLARYYRPGARIYVFGFSRGAYTARLFAAMVHNFGVLRPEAVNLAPYLWQTMSEVGTIGAFKHSANRIKRDFSIEGETPIHFMGLFDTVSSVGVLQRFLTYPNTDFNPSVLRTCHAVSIDEERNCFPECLMHPGQQNLTEVWFPGVHRDVGGGDSAHSKISDVTHAWIAGEAKASGLALQLPTPGDPGLPEPNYAPFDPYVMIGLYPMRMFTKDVSAYRTRWPNLFHIRTIPEGAFVHELAVKMRDATGSKYRPVNWPSKYVKFPAAQGAAPPDRYELRLPGTNVADIAGVILGSALLFLLWNWSTGSPFGDTWPQWSSKTLWPSFDVDTGAIRRDLVWSVSAITMVIAIGLIFLGLQSIGQALTDKLPVWRRWRTGALMACLAPFPLIVLGLMYGQWRSVWWGVGLGVLFAAFAQVPGRPALPADRTLPYLAGGAVAAAVTLRLFDAIAGPDALGFDAIAVFIYWGVYSVLAIVKDRGLMAAIRDGASKPATRAPSDNLCRGLRRLGLCGALLALLWLFGESAEKHWGGLAGLVGTVFAVLGAIGLEVEQSSSSRKEKTPSPFKVTMLIGTVSWLISAVFNSLVTLTGPSAQERTVIAHAAPIFPPLIAILVYVALNEFTVQRDRKKLESNVKSIEDQIAGTSDKTALLHLKADLNRLKKDQKVAEKKRMARTALNL